MRDLIRLAVLTLAEGDSSLSQGRRRDRLEAYPTSRWPLDDWLQDLVYGRASVGQV